jgi:hypothetical protein
MRPWRGTSHPCDHPGQVAEKRLAEHRGGRAWQAFQHPSVAVVVQRAVGEDPGDRDAPPVQLGYLPRDVRELFRKVGIEAPFDHDGRASEIGVARPALPVTDQPSCGDRKAEPFPDPIDPCPLSHRGHHAARLLRSEQGEDGNDAARPGVGDA